MSTTDFGTSARGPIGSSAVRDAPTTRLRIAGRPASRRSPAPGDSTPDWREDAACLQRDLNLFFPISNVGAAAQRQILEAKRVCSECPVQTACLSWALTVGPEFGIFGGHTEDERRQLRRQSGRGRRLTSTMGVQPAAAFEAGADAL